MPDSARNLTAEIKRRRMAATAARAWRALPALVTPREVAVLTFGAALLAAALLLSACSGPRVSHPEAAAKIDRAATGSAFRAGGFALLTPTSSSDHQADRQSVADIFAAALKSQRPDIPVTDLPATLSAINAAGLATAYGRLYASYKETGLFDREPLRQIGQAVRARYLVQLSLASFSQESSGGMFSMMGVSLGKQQSATVRLLAQVWDSTEGKIVWEQSDEASERKRSLIRSRTIKMEDVVKASAKDLIKALPR